MWTVSAVSSAAPWTSTSRSDARTGRAEEAFLGHPQPVLGPGPHQRAVLSATAHGVSLNSWIKQAVEEKASR